MASWTDMWGCTLPVMLIEYRLPDQCPCVRYSTCIYDTSQEALSSSACDFVSGYFLKTFRGINRDSHAAVTDSGRSQIRAHGKAGPLQLPRSDDPSPPHLLWVQVWVSNGSQSFWSSSAARNLNLHPATLLFFLCVFVTLKTSPRS